MIIAIIIATKKNKSKKEKSLQKTETYIFFEKKEGRKDATIRSFIKRQTRDISSDNESERVTTNDNEWYNE